MKAAAFAVFAALIGGPAVAQAPPAFAIAPGQGDVMVLLGLEPGGYVADLLPQSDSWTRLLIAAVGDTGKLCVFVPAELKDAPGDPQGRVRALAADHPNARLCAPPLAAKGGHDVFDAALMADAQKLLHGPDFKAADVAGFHHTLLEELKPGAPYVVIGGAGDATPQAIRAELEAAGYVFDMAHDLGGGRFALRFVKPGG
jgi:predicted methyltransferase